MALTFINRPALGTTLLLSYIISRSSCLNLSENATPDQLKDFLEEITLMKGVGSHKNIVNLIGCYTKSLPNFLIVEYAVKGDLLSYVRERRKRVNSSKIRYECL